MSTINIIKLFGEKGKASRRSLRTSCRVGARSLSYERISRFPKRRQITLRSYQSSILDMEVYSHVADHKPQMRWYFKRIFTVRKTCFTVPLRQIQKLQTKTNKQTRESSIKFSFPSDFGSELCYTTNCHGYAKRTFAVKRESTRLSSSKA